MSRSCCAYLLLLVFRTNPDKFGQVRIQNEPPRHTHGGLHRYISQYLLGRHQNQYWIRSRSPRRVSEPLLLSLFTVGDFSDKSGQIRTCPNLKFEKNEKKKNIFHKYFSKFIKNIFINIKIIDCAESAPIVRKLYLVHSL